MRESYLQRHSNPVTSKWGAIIQTTDQFETKTEGIYKSGDESILPGHGLINYHDKVSTLKSDHE